MDQPPQVARQDRRRRPSLSELLPLLLTLAGALALLAVIVGIIMWASMASVPQL